MSTYICSPMPSDAIKLRVIKEIKGSIGLKMPDLPVGSITWLRKVDPWLPGSKNNSCFIEGNRYYANISHDCFEEVVDKSYGEVEIMTVEEARLLEEAKKLYPVGSYVYQLYAQGTNNLNKEIMITDHSLITYNNGDIDYDHQWRLYVCSYPSGVGTWATKVLGANVSKELTELPKKWCIRVSDNGERSNPEIWKWRNFYWSHAGYVDNTKYYNTHKLENYTEITLDQFKRWVLKESAVQPEEEWIPRVGDWVISELSYCTLSPNRASQIMKVHNSGNRLQLAEGHFDTKDFRKALPHEIPQDNTKSLSASAAGDMNAILEEARRKYPVGTKVTNNNLGLCCTFIVEGSDFVEYGKRELSYCTKARSYYTIYRDGTWADIVSLPEKANSNPDSLVGRWVRHKNGVHSKISKWNRIGMVDFEDGMKDVNIHKANWGNICDPCNFIYDYTLMPEGFTPSDAESEFIKSQKAYEPADDLVRKRTPLGNKFCVYVNTLEESHAVQKELFKQGCRWRSDSVYGTLQDHVRMYIHVDGTTITFGVSSEEKEVSVSEILNVPLKKELLLVTKHEPADFIDKDRWIAKKMHDEYPSTPEECIEPQKVYKTSSAVILTNTDDEKPLLVTRTKKAVLIN